MAVALQRQLPSPSVSSRAAMDAYSYKSMEYYLIEEVRKRPEIYDKNTAAYRNFKIREQAWKDVAKALNITDVEVVRKRWSTLRDSFIKIQRSLKHNPKQVIKWLYYKQFSFLNPHLDSKISVEEASKSGSEETQDASPLRSDSGSQFMPEEVLDVSSQDRTLKKREFDEDPLAAETLTKKHCCVCDGNQLPAVKHVDADEQFLLSCLPVLKRLRKRDNAVARLKIQQLLFDIEFGEEQNEGLLVTKVEVDDD